MYRDWELCCYSQLASMSFNVLLKVGWLLTKIWQEGLICVILPTTSAYKCYVDIRVTLYVASPFCVYISVTCQVVCIVYVVRYFLEVS